MRRAPEEYERLGKRAILELLDEQLAVPSIELEARLAEERWPSIGVSIDPHHLRPALNALGREGRLHTLTASGKGGRQITIHHAIGGRRATAVHRTVQRKRALMARYLGWAQGTESRAGVTGPAAERVLHASLVQTATYRLVRPQGGNVSTFLGHVLAGPLDSAVFLTPLVDGMPGTPLAIPIEVKNHRDWIYPVSQDLYQLLDKAARLQASHPLQPMVPVLVCRRAHYTAFQMAKAMGFFIAEARRQFISPSIPEERLREARAELGLSDLVAREGADDKLVRLFGEVLPKGIADRAERWQLTASDGNLRAGFSEMWRDPLITRRARTLDTIRQLAVRAGIDGGW